jgi:2-oxoacid:acceptor oxidoreductase gamma subunit (pyruvate/2-ketoisovalerate family)
MNEIKFIGRGGQGVVLSSQILGLAFFNAGLYPQCFSVFGGERRGAPVISFLRVDREKILLKCGIRNPHEIVCLDAGLIDAGEIRSSLRPGGRICINTERPSEAYDALFSFTLALVDARKISDALDLGRVVNTAILGAYWRMSQDLPIECLLSAIESTIPSQKEGNLEAARRAYGAVRIYEPGNDPPAGRSAAPCSEVKDG